MVIFTEAKELQTAYNAVTIDKYNQISSYHDIREQLERLSTEFRSIFSNEARIFTSISSTWKTSKST